MLSRLIGMSLHHRWAVLVGMALLAALGWSSLTRLNVDAFPDTTPVQVQVNTVASALVPEEVERQITFPVELSLSGLPRLQQMRSISQFGLSQVVVTFEDGTDIYFARQLINERLAQVQLPPGIERPEMGPVSTGLGEVYHYVVSGETEHPTELRTVHDWTIKPELRSVAGTAEINSWGGYQKQFQVRLNPDHLIRYNVTFDEVSEAIARNNLNVGGGNLHRHQSGEMLLVHGIGRTVTLDQIRNIVVETHDGVPIRIRDLAEVVIGHELRRGAVTANGQGEVVLGLGFMRMGESSYTVTQRLKDKMETAKELIPSHVHVDTVYDRTLLVDQVIATVRKNLCEGAFLVVAVLFVFLGNLRAGLIVAAAIPLAMLLAFIGMHQAGIAATLLSLGAIDFGIVVESSVIVIESVVRHLAHHGQTAKSKLRLVHTAVCEVRQPCVFGQIIIMIVYIPILTLQGVEGKMFQPMAWTVLFVLVGSLILSLTVIPALAYLCLPRQMEEKDPWIVRVAQWFYNPILHVALRLKYAVLVLTAFAMGGMVWMATQLGSEFVPRLAEGAVVVGIIRAPGTDLEESVRLNTQMEQLILQKFPHEVEHVWSRTGAPEVATDPGGVESSDLFITLRPRSEWKACKSQTEFVTLLERQLAAFPGQTIWYTQPIEQRINEMISGVRSDIAVKVFGDDLDVILAKAREIEDLLKTVSGSADLAVEQITGQPIMQVRVRQDEVARYGLSAAAVLQVVEAMGGKVVGEIMEGQLRFPLAVRLPEHFRQDPQALANLLLSTPSGEQIPLSRMADIKVVSGPKMIPRESGQRRITVQCNVRGRDLGSFVKEAQQKINAQVQFPAGRYKVVWGGQFENMERAASRLVIVVPVALGLILLLLYITYRNVIDTLFIFGSVPLACIGGVFCLWYREMPLSISAAVGFITLSGVSVLNSMVFVTAVRDLQRQGRATWDAIIEASITRLRPVLMTAVVATVGFLPMALSEDVGAEVQRPLATVVMGGVISKTLLSLVVFPVLYLFAGRPASAVQTSHKPEDQLELDPETRALLATLQTLGEMERDLGRPQSAAEHWKRAIEILEPAVALDHPTLVELRAKYASVCEKTGTPTTGAVVTTVHGHVIQEHPA